jgi:hypothetical protein
MMQAEGLEKSVRRAQLVLGVPLTYRSSNGNESEIEIRISEYPSPRGFSLMARRGPLSWRGELTWDTFPGSALRIMKEASDSDFLRFQESIRQSEVILDEFEFLVDSKEPDADFTTWSDLTIRAESRFDFSGGPSGPDQTSVGMALSRLIEAALLPVVGLLLESEESGDLLENDAAAQRWDVEGRRLQGTYSRYERSRRNRAACLAYRGLDCMACGINVEKVYGSVAAGFIHVHHIERVSDMEKPREINPLVDLVPLCPTCHAVAHLRVPPIPIDELQRLILQSEQPNSSFAG